MISFKLAVEAASFTKGMSDAVHLMDSFSKQAAKTQQASQQLTLEAPATSTGKGKQGADAASAGPGADVAQSAYFQASVIASALQSAMAPINQIQSQMIDMANRAGGAMVTLARRIDGAMKMPGVWAMLNKLDRAVNAPFAAINSAISATQKRFIAFGSFSDTLAGSLFGDLMEGISLFANHVNTTFRSTKKSVYAHWSSLVTDMEDVFDSGMGYGVGAILRGLGAAFIGTFGVILPATTKFASSMTSALARVPLDMIKGFLKVKGFFSSFGDVAKKGLDKLFNFKLTRQIAETAGFSGALGTVGKVANKTGITIKQFGSQVLAALGVFGLAYKLVDFFRMGIKGASDLNETVNKTGVVFADQASVVTKAADQMADRFGMVKGQFQDAADTFGQLLIGMGGQSQKTAAETSVNLAKMAADASSIFNVSFEEASGKIASALRGQSEPISAFGVDVQEAAVKAEAARMGIAGMKGELSTAQKVAARTSLVMQGLAVAQGDLENTADAPANAMRKFMGTMTNMANDIGTILIPAVQSALAAANDFAASLSEGFATAKDDFGIFAAELAAGFDTIGVVIRNFPLVWDIAVLGVQQGILDMMAHIETIPKNLAIIADYIAGNWYKLITDTFTALGAVIKNFAENMKNLAKAAFNWAFSGDDFEFDWTPLLDGFKATMAELPKMVDPAFVSLQDEIDAKMAEIAKNETDRANKMKKAGERAKRPLAREQGEGEATGKKDKTTKEPGLAGAFQLGSAEAASAVAQYGSRAKDAAALNTARNTAQANKLLGQINNNLKPKPGGNGGNGLVAREF